MSISLALIPWVSQICLLLAVTQKCIRVCMHAVLDDRCDLMKVRYRSLVIMNVNRQDSQIWSESELKSEACNVKVTWVCCLLSASGHMLTDTWSERCQLSISRVICWESSCDGSVFNTTCLIVSQGGLRGETPFLFQPQHKVDGEVWVPTEPIVTPLLPPSQGSLQLSYCLICSALVLLLFLHIYKSKTLLFVKQIA